MSSCSRAGPAGPAGLPTDHRLVGVDDPAQIVSVEVQVAVGAPHCLRRVEDRNEVLGIDTQDGLDAPAVSLPDDVVKAAVPGRRPVVVDDRLVGLVVVDNRLVVGNRVETALLGWARPAGVDRSSPSSCLVPAVLLAAGFGGGGRRHRDQPRDST